MLKKLFLFKKRMVFLNKNINLCLVFIIINYDNKQFLSKFAP
ncbi:hypothetical protein FEM21_04140 [Flavobacterium seoulense]|uniref:Uncharacterized protein n=1 Tax=Flavobacterium seoulense TaxID=1492738 RepID=A0A066X0H7_9FLAO|nr:hypothetical protein FEM21_04140 [Flavobacterium seoulense]